MTMECPSITKPRSYVDEDMPRAESAAVAGGVVSVFTSRSPGETSAANEDAAMVFPLGNGQAVLAVADGMGGGQVGEKASRLALQALHRALEQGTGQTELLRTQILDGIESANRVVCEMGVGAATTLVVAELRDGVVRTYHVGDSMILLVGQRGKIKLQTTRHSPVGFALEAGQLNEQEAMLHEDRHLVSNVIGVQDMRIEIGPEVRLARFDTLLLASDGLFDNLFLDEIVQIIRSGRIERGAGRLQELARGRMTDGGADLPGKPDDLTFILYRRSS